MHNVKEIMKFAYLWFQTTKKPWKIELVLKHPWKVQKLLLNEVENMQVIFLHLNPNDSLSILLYKFKLVEKGRENQGGVKESHVNC